MRDFIEHLEASAEASAEALGMDADGMRCAGCQTFTAFSDLHPASANPYAMPVCGACLEMIYPELANVDPSDFPNGHPDQLS